MPTVTGKVTDAKIADAAKNVRRHLRFAEEAWAAGNPMTAYSQAQEAKFAIYELEGLVADAADAADAKEAAS